MAPLAGIRIFHANPRGYWSYFTSIRYVVDVPLVKVEEGRRVGLVGRRGVGRRVGFFVPTLGGLGSGLAGVGGLGAGTGVGADDVKLAQNEGSESDNSHTFSWIQLAAPEMREYTPGNSPPAQAAIISQGGGQR